VTDAGERWAAALEEWAIPDHILSAAPVSPWGFSVAGFADRARRQREQPTPAHTIAADAIPVGGSVLDVGCGGGAASLPLVPPAGHLAGVDASQEMLDAYVEAAHDLAVEVSTIHGHWPDVAAEVADDSHDVVIAQDVLYNVADIDGFVTACHRVARRRVVLVLPTVHPMSWTAPYWLALHGIQRPTRPTVDDASEVLDAHGIVHHRTTWTEPTLWAVADLDDAVAMVRTRLCLSEDRDDDVRTALADEPPPRERDAVVLWWDVSD
jgi:2-polyprenyl-3-methyl-5-hydroxy-6-metoxy-1,4-benzoquinol methylase